MYNIYIYIRKRRYINVITFAGHAGARRDSFPAEKESPLPSFNSLEGEGGDTEAAESPFCPFHGVEMAPIKMAMTWGWFMMYITS
jgi:hypothetical protein